MLQCDYKSCIKIRSCAMCIEKMRCVERKKNENVKKYKRKKCDRIKSKYLRKVKKKTKLYIPF